MYKIFARKYRPECFADVLEQGHVTVTLMRAIKSQKVGQAYLFSGPRGVGKTTVARVLVKTLNCENPSDDGTRCCGECLFCVEIAKGISLDYQEIDGASHRGIDQIREIKNNLPYASANNKYRVFVIDEAHMLTAEAFNAMLKSLEEPPEKVIFILCTTESGKIPLTIRSRCQHFRFKLVSRQKLEEMLLNIAKQESIETDGNALFYVAKHAGGSIRDAQNLLEQVAAYAGGVITREKTLAALGEVSKEVLYKFMVNLEAGSLDANYILVEEIMGQGGSFATFLYECVALLSSFTYLQEGVKESQLFHMSTEDMKLFYELSQQFKRDEIYKLLDCLFEFIQEFKNTTEERTLRDLALIKLHRYKKLISNEEIRESLVLLAKASDLAEEEPASSPPPPSSSSSPSPSSPSSPSSGQSLSDARKEQAVQEPKSSEGGSTATRTSSPVTASQQTTPQQAPPQQVAPQQAPPKQAPPKQVPPKQATPKSTKLVIDNWNEDSYRSLMTLASRGGHAISKKLNQLSLQGIDQTGKLVLMENHQSVASDLLDNFEEEFTVYLQTLVEKNQLELKRPLPPLKLLPNVLVEQTKTIANVFKNSRVVPE